MPLLLQILKNVTREDFEAGSAQLSVFVVGRPLAAATEAVNYTAFATMPLQTRAAMSVEVALAGIAFVDRAGELSFSSSLQLRSWDSSRLEHALYGCPVWHLMYAVP